VTYLWRINQNRIKRFSSFQCRGNPKGFVWQKQPGNSRMV